MDSATFTDDEKAEMIALQREAMDILRRAETCDSELARIKNSPGQEETRSALIFRRNGLHRQRSTVVRRLREIQKRHDDTKRRQILGLMAGVSPTAQLREAARRTGALEQMYIQLVRGLNGDREGFDWRIPVQKAQRVLATLPIGETAEDDPPPTPAGGS